MTRLAWFIAATMLVTVASVPAIAQPDPGDAGKAALAGTGIGVGIRALGLGGAYTVLSRDATSLYWNPAALGRIRGFSWSTPLGAKSDRFDLLSDTSDIYDAIDSDTIDLDVFGTLRDIAIRANGNAVSATTGAMTGFAGQGVGIGGFAEAGLDAVPAYVDLRPLGGDESVYFQGSSAWYYSVGAGFGKRVSRFASVGIGVRNVWAGMTYGSYFATSDGYSVTSNADTRTIDDSAIAVDLGLLVTPSPYVSAGLTVRNVNSPSLTLHDGSVAKSLDLEPIVNVGVAARQQDWVVALDVHNLLDANDAGMSFHLGTEKWVGENVAVRAGLHDGDLVFGLGVYAGPFTMNLAFDPGFDSIAGLEMGLEF